MAGPSTPQTPPAGVGGAGPAGDRGRPVGRRVVLGMLGLGAAGVVAGRRIGDGVAAVARPLTSRAPAGLASLVPGGDGFRIYTVTDGFPADDPATWRLTVDGLVATPATYTLADLQAMPRTRLVRDFQCVTGWRVPGVAWEGVTLQALIDRSSPHPAATAVRFESFDGTYTESLTLAQAARPDVIVADRMQGRPLSDEHGGPARLYVAPMYGYKSCKWLSRITLTPRVEPGYWETEGNYDVDAWVGASNGRDDPATG
ncbi:MAG TPA: molybdopterin-dependent oxidoreductase [Acidimicrobiales bacterium]|nr:molybdopterin-dependent oxidoreductase [Acidimicrobiales bacterium]